VQVSSTEDNGTVFLFWPARKECVMNRPTYRLIGNMSAAAVFMLLFVSHFRLPENAVQAGRSSVGNDYQEIIATTSKYGKQLAEGHPDAMKGFQTLGQAVLKPGALDTKTKELIALGLAVASRCDACIASHTRNAIEAGATREEIIETLGVTILMGGGPSLAYSTHVLEAIEQLESAEN
jgi:AhpD family alkylhydroperoxidase